MFKFAIYNQTSTNVVFYHKENVTQHLLNVMVKVNFYLAGKKVLFVELIES